MGGILHRRFGNFGGMSPWLLFGCLCPVFWLRQGRYLSESQLRLVEYVPKSPYGQIISKPSRGPTSYNSIPMR